MTHQYDSLLKAVQDAHIFQRNKIALERKVLACLLYMAGLSYSVMTLQTGIIIPTCYRFVHYWMQKLRGITSRVQAKDRRFVAIDETKQKVNGRQLFVWEAIDTETRELLAIWASYQRSSSAALVFVKRVLETCTNKPVVLVDGGPWYPWALERYGLRWLHVTFGERNSIERFYNNINARTNKIISLSGLPQPLLTVVQSPQVASGSKKNPGRRTRYLNSIAKREKFDELFINGREDFDLAVRLAVAGYRCGLLKYQIGSIGGTTLSGDPATNRLRPLRDILNYVYFDRKLRSLL